MVLAVAAGRFCGIMSTSKKDFPIELIQKLISFGCFDRCPRGLDRPSLVLLFYFFFLFHQLKLPFYDCTLMFKESGRQRQPR